MQPDAVPFPDIDGPEKPTQSVQIPTDADWLRQVKQLHWLMGIVWGWLRSPRKMPDEWVKRERHLLSGGD